MKKNVTREFNRLYGNLVELHNRVYDDSFEYPRVLCAKWFVDTLATVVGNEDFSNMLTEQQISDIMRMSQDFLKSNFLDKNFKRSLRLSLKELNNVKTNTLGL
ncbi:MAG: hypothetical protein IJ371_04380 [Clostridia bacterium]|nr:hypothetical protein [Clostridia bacterium]